MLRYFNAVASGVLLFLIHPPLNWCFLAFVALLPLLIEVNREPSWKRRALLGLITGCVHWAGMCYWIHFVMSVHGGLGNIGGALVFVLFCLGCALGTAGFAVVAGPLLKTRFAVVSVASLWVVNEWVPAPYGFTWLGLGDAAVDTLLAYLGPWTGVYGMTFLAAMCSAAAMRSRWMAASMLLFLLAGSFWRPHYPVTGDRSAVVLQPNIPTEKEWTDQEVIQLGQRLEFLTLQAATDPKPDLSIWPEVPAPFYFDTDGRFRERASSVARLSGIPFLFGTVGYTAQRQPLNSAILLGPDGVVLDRYSKVELVPFGEYVPPPFASIVPRITSEVSDFVPGSRLTTFNLAGHKVSAFICYESAFPSLVRRFDGELLVNLSNDGYFGTTTAREQHLKLVRMRAIENGRWILRATNDGYTVSINPRGAIAKQLDPRKELAARLPFRYETTETLYRKWGDWFVHLCMVIVTVSFALLKYNKHS